MKKLLKFFPDIIAVPVVFAIWIATNHFLYWLDPTAKGLDIGYLNDAIVAAIYIMVGMFIFKGLLKFHFPSAYDYLTKPEGGKTRIHTDLLELTSWQRIALFISFLLIFLLMFIWAVNALHSGFKV